MLFSGDFMSLRPKSHFESYFQRLGVKSGANFNLKNGPIVMITIQQDLQQDEGKEDSNFSLNKYPNSDLRKVLYVGFNGN
jgi:hypothetical protein